MLQPRKFSASIEFNSEHSNVIFLALKPEVGREMQGKSIADVRASGKKVIIDISSNDLPNFRAALNSYLRLVRTASSCLDVTL